VRSVDLQQSSLNDANIFDREIQNPIRTKTQLQSKTYKIQQLDD